VNPDPAAPVAIYCRSDGIHVYNVDRTGRGSLAFVASYNQINAVGIPSVNTLIASGGGVGLYRLTSGEFQVNSTRASSTQGKRPALVQQDGGPVIHVVQQGENLFRIAIRYGTTIDAIAAANGIVDVTRIYVGQRLIIPAGSAPPGTLPGATGVNVPAPSSAGIGSGYVFIFNGC
jgi:LysM repeat protein